MLVEIHAEAEPRAGDETGIVVGGIGFGSTGGPKVFQELLCGLPGFQSKELVAQTDEGSCPFTKKKVATTCLEAGLAK